MTGKQTAFESWQASYKGPFGPVEAAEAAWNAALEVAAKMLDDLAAEAIRNGAARESRAHSEVAAAIRDLTAKE